MNMISHEVRTFSGAVITWSFVTILVLIHLHTFRISTEEFEILS